MLGARIAAMKGKAREFRHIEQLDELNQQLDQIQRHLTTEHARLRTLRFMNAKAAVERFGDGVLRCYRWLHGRVSFAGDPLEDLRLTVSDVHYATDARELDVLRNELVSSYRTFCLFVAELDCTPPLELMEVPKRLDHVSDRTLDGLRSELALGIWRAAECQPAELPYDGRRSIDQILSRALWVSMASILPRVASNGRGLARSLAEPHTAHNISRRLARRAVACMATDGLILPAQSVQDGLKKCFRETVPVDDWSKLGLRAVRDVRLQVLHQLVAFQSRFRQTRRSSA